MGGVAATYCRPVDPVDGRMSSWKAHTNRGTPSTEPGVDYFCPIGTPVRAAAAGRVVHIGNSIQPATGRYVTIDLDDGNRVRYLHLLRSRVKVGQRVKWGQHVADSGATGYGEADWSWNVAGTGGAHVHMTLWDGHYYKFGRYATLDPEKFMAPHQGGNQEDDMFDEADRDRILRIENALNNAKAGIWTGGSVKIDGRVRKFNYGVLPIVAHNQTLIAQQSGRIAAIEAVVEQLATANGAVLDMGAIADAAERGAKEALRGLTLTAEVG